MARVPVAGRFSARWLHAVVEAHAGKPLRAVSIYGLDSGHPDAAEQNAALFQEVFEAMAELGAAQWVAGGDWNEEAAAIWSLVAAEGRALLLPRAVEEAGQAVMGTCVPGGRTIDFFVPSASMADRVGVEAVQGTPRCIRIGRCCWASRSEGRRLWCLCWERRCFFFAPGDPLPVGPRPSGEREWQGRVARWGRLFI